MYFFGGYTGTYSVFKLVSTKPQEPKPTRYTGTYSVFKFIGGF